MPFGEELYPEVYRKAGDKYGATDSVRQRFTGYQKDSETGLDFAEARYYNNQHGRFTAVDPLLASGKSANPQTFNRYVYVMNNPLAYTDPSGLQAGTPAPNYRGRVYTNGQGLYSNYKDKEFNTRYRGGTTYVTDNGNQYRVTRNGWTFIGIPPASTETTSSVETTSSTNSQELPSGVYVHEGGSGSFHALKTKTTIKKKPMMEYSTKKGKVYVSEAKKTLMVNLLKMPGRTV